MQLPKWSQLLYCLFTALVLGLFSLATAQTAHAAEFSSLLIRPDRTKAGVAPGSILIQARVGEAVTEDGVRITLGSAWSGSATASTYTVSTSSLPSGVTAWPGIGTATGVSGQESTFPSGDLSSGTTYGFYLTGGIATNPASAGDSAGYLWTVATLVGGSPSSLSDAMVAIGANDQVAISATIEPPADDFSAVLSTTSDITDIPQDSTITYTITYGSEYDFASPLTIQAEWTLGTISGNGTPTVELLSYVPGSADDAYGSTSPVINLTDRTITWTIASIPANTTGETVTFKLETTDSYTGSSEVTATTMARITNPVSTTDSESEISYTYVAPASSGSSSSASPTPSPTTSTTTASPSPSPSPSPAAAIQFESYAVTQVSDTNVELFVALSSASPLTIRYGRTPTALTTVRTSPSTRRHSIFLDQLLPNTTYYVQLSIPSSSGQEVLSDLLQFQTAQTGAVPTPNSVTITSNGSHLWTGPTANNSPFLLPSDQTIELSLSIANDALIESIVLYRDLNGEDIYTTTFVRTQPGIWSTRLLSPITAGELEYSATIRTTLGNQQHVPIFMIWISPPLRVIDGVTKQPLERARILLSRKDPITNIFTQLLAPEYLQENPLFSRHDGSLPFALPPGEYKAEVSAIGYQQQSVNFSTLAHTTFPTVELQPTGSALLSALMYHSQTIALKAAQLAKALQTEAQSSATLKLVTLWTIAVSAPLSVLGLLAQAQFSVFTLFRTVFHHFGFLLGKGLGSASYIPGSILSSDSKTPIDAILSLVDPNGKTLAILQTHRDGRFAIPAKFLGSTSVSLVAIAQGYAPQTISVDRASTSIQLELSPEGENGWKNTFKAVLKRIMINAFETNLALSLFLGFAFTFLYQSPAAKPFLALSVVNASIFAISRISAYLHTVHFGKE